MRKGRTGKVADVLNASVTVIRSQQHGNDQRCATSWNMGYVLAYVNGRPSAALSLKIAPLSCNEGNERGLPGSPWGVVDPRLVLEGADGTTTTATTNNNNDDNNNNNNNNNSNNSNNNNNNNNRNSKKGVNAAVPAPHSAAVGKRQPAASAIGFRSPIPTFAPRAC
eukprot:gene11544-biopygen6284